MTDTDIFVRSKGMQRIIASLMPVCTGIPVSRKKILTMAHPSAVIVAADGTGSLHERRPMRPDQTHSVSLL
ncbi:MAG: hypothetical protein WCJ47_03245 [Methanomicrobiales archaeon]